MGRRVAIRFVAELQRQAEQTYNNLFTYEQLYQIAQGTPRNKLSWRVGYIAKAYSVREYCCGPPDLHLQIPNMSDFIESLNHHGYLLKKGHRVYKVQTASI